MSFAVKRSSYGGTAPALRGGASFAWIAGLILCGLTAGCDLDIKDIAVNSGNHEQPNGSGKDAGPGDAGAAGASGTGTAGQPPKRKPDRGETMDASTLPIVDEGTDENPTHTSRHVTRKPTKKPDAGIEDRDAGVEDRDADTDDTDGSSPGESDPCENGTFVCNDISVVVKPDYGVAAVTATLTATFGGYEFQVQSPVGGQVVLHVPTGVWGWLSTSADGYRTSEGPAFFDVKLQGGDIIVVSTNFINFALGTATDPSKGFVLAGFESPPVDPGAPIDADAGPFDFGGAGLDLGRPTGQPLVFGPSGIVPSPTLITGGDRALFIPDVELGTLTPVPYGPPGQFRTLAASIDAVFESKPQTVLFLHILCNVTTP